MSNQGENFKDSLDADKNHSKGAAPEVRDSNNIGSPTQQGIEMAELVGDDAAREWSDSILSQEFADSIQSALDDLFAETGPGAI